MQSILPDILTLAQHNQILNEAPEQYRPERCICCGKSAPWRHGFYPRKSDREHTRAESLNPVLIPRFFCPDCKKTSSVLPEGIPPRRWYLWLIQQQILLQLLLGSSFNSAHKTQQSDSSGPSPSRSTLRRWWVRLKEQFQQQRDALCAYCYALAQHADCVGFWRHCFTSISLSKAMLICQQSGVAVP